MEVRKRHDKKLGFDLRRIPALQKLHADPAGYPAKRANYDAAPYSCAPSGYYGRVDKARFKGNEERDGRGHATGDKR